MFTKTLLPDTLRALQLVGKTNIIKKAYLAGGTALALQTGHRISVDLDFFTSEKFNEEQLALDLSNIQRFTKESVSSGTILGKIGQTKFSLFYYPYPLIEKTCKFDDIQLASKADLAAMKLHALEDRGTKRDFVDVFFLAQEFSFAQMLKFYDKKYTVLKDHLYSIIRSLDYFADADAETLDPQMLVKISWPKIKEFFHKQSLRLTKKYLLH